MENEKSIVPIVDAKPARNNYAISMSNGYQTNLKRNVDFGMISKKDGTPISSRPTLFASGKDKILTGLGLIYLSDIVERKTMYILLKKLM